MPIINIVSSGSLNQILDLVTLTSNSDLEIIYNPQKYHGAYLIIEGKKVTLYKSGKYIITGLKKIEDVGRFFDLIKDILSLNLDISLFTPPVIQNIVITDTLNTRLNLTTLIQQHPEVDIEYEPEQFPGLICKRPEGTILLFSSGKMVLVGLKTVDDGITLKSFVEGLN